MSWSLLIRATGDRRYAASVKGRRVTGWFKDFWRLYSAMEKREAE